MSLAHITAKIEADARQEADEILAKSRSQADAIRNKCREELEQLDKATTERIAAERPEVFRRREIVANLDVQKELLITRRRVLDEAFERALEKLNELDEERYLALCENLLSEASSIGDEIVIVNPAEQYITESWIEEFNRKYKKDLVLGEGRESLTGGFMLIRDRIRVNCAWEMLLKVFREDREIDVAKRFHEA